MDIPVGFPVVFVGEFRVVSPFTVDEGLGDGREAEAGDALWRDFVDNFNLTDICLGEAMDDFDFVAIVPGEAIAPVEAARNGAAIFVGDFGEEFGAKVVGILPFATLNEGLVVVLWVVFFLDADERVCVVAGKDWEILVLSGIAEGLLGGDFFGSEFSFIGFFEMEIEIGEAETFVAELSENSLGGVDFSGVSSGDKNLLHGYIMA